MLHLSFIFIYFQQLALILNYNFFVHFPGSCLICWLFSSSV